MSLVEAFEVLRTVSGVNLNPVILVLEYIDGPSLTPTCVIIGLHGCCY